MKNPGPSVYDGPGLCPGLFAAALLAAFLLNVLSAGIPAWRAACGTIVDSLSGNED